MKISAAKKFALGTAAVCLVAIGVAVVQLRGLEQLGTYVSLLGSLALFIPPYRQLIKNRIFSRSINYQSSDKEQQRLNAEVEETRRKEFLAYSRQDYACALLGLVLTVLGVALSIYTSKPNTTPAQSSAQSQNSN